MEWNFTLWEQTITKVNFFYMFATKCFITNIKILKCNVLTLSLLIEGAFAVCSFIVAALHFVLFSKLIQFQNGVTTIS